MKIIRPNELAKLLHISTTTLWRMEKRGDLPQRIKLSTRAVGWLESDIQEWLKNRPKSCIQTQNEEV
jgi:prophage regulatory protein